MLFINNDKIDARTSSRFIEARDAHRAVKNGLWLLGAV
jgi:hypothetical protein